MNPVKKVNLFNQSKRLFNHLYVLKHVTDSKNPFRPDSYVDSGEGFYLYEFTVRNNLPRDL